MLSANSHIPTLLPANLIPSDILVSPSSSTFLPGAALGTRVANLSTLGQIMASVFLLFFFNSRATLMQMETAAKHSYTR